MTNITVGATIKIIIASIIRSFLVLIDELDFEDVLVELFPLPFEVEFVPPVVLPLPPPFIVVVVFMPCGIVVGTPPPLLPPPGGAVPYSTS